MPGQAPTQATRLGEEALQSIAAGNVQVTQELQGAAQRPGGSPDPTHRDRAQPLDFFVQGQSPVRTILELTPQLAQVSARLRQLAINAVPPIATLAAFFLGQLEFVAQFRSVL